MVELKFIRTIINYHRNLWFCTVWHRAVLRWLVLTHNLWKMSEILPMHKDHICMITVLRWLLVMVWPCQFYPRDLSMHNAHKVNYPKKKIILFIVCFERKCFCSWELVGTTWELSKKKSEIIEKKNRRNIKICVLCQKILIILYIWNQFTLNIVCTFIFFYELKIICVGIKICICFGVCPFKVN